MLITSLFALITGGKIMTAWLTPYYVFVPLQLILWHKPVAARRPLIWLAAMVILFIAIHVLVVGNEFLYVRPYTGTHCNHQVYPGRKLALTLTKAWREQFGRPCPYVIGSRKESCYMCYYSPDHPRAFFDHEEKLSPWIDPADIQKQGAVIIWREHHPPEYVKHYPDARRLPPIILERQMPPWFRAIAPAPKTVTFHAVFIPPAR